MSHPVIYKIDTTETKQKGGECCDLSQEEWSKHSAGIPRLCSAASAASRPWPWRKLLRKHVLKVWPSSKALGAVLRNGAFPWNVLHLQAIDKKVVTQQNKVSPSEDHCSSLWTTGSSSEVTAPGKEQLLKSHALCTQTSLFQLFIRDIVLLHLDFVKPTYLLLANTAIEPHNPEIQKTGICSLRVQSWKRAWGPLVPLFWIVVCPLALQLAPKNLPIIRGFFPFRASGNYVTGQSLISVSPITQLYHWNAVDFCPSQQKEKLARVCLKT